MFGEISRKREIGVSPAIGACGCVDVKRNLLQRHSPVMGTKSAKARIETMPPLGRGPDLGPMRRRGRNKT